MQYLFWGDEPEWEREVQAFKDLEYLLDVDAVYYLRPSILREYSFASLDLPKVGLHLHAQEEENSGHTVWKEGDKSFKIWSPGIGKNKQVSWARDEIVNSGRIAMDLPGRGFTDKTEVLNVHVCAERQALYDYVRLLAEAKRRGLKWKRRSG